MHAWHGIACFGRQRVVYLGFPAAYVMFVQSGAIDCVENKTVKRLDLNRRRVENP